MREIELSWTALKALKTAKGLNFNFDENAAATLIEVFLGDIDILWFAKLTDSGDITDFNNNYRSAANKYTPNKVMLSNNTKVVSVITEGANERLAVSSDVTSVVPGTGATTLGKAEDAPHTSGDVGVMSLAVRHDAQTSLVSAEYDYAPLQVDSLGNLRVVNAGDVDSVELRKGKLFYINVWNDNFGIGSFISIHFTTPASPTQIFFKWSYEITFGAYFEFYEGGTYSGGTSYTPLNRNRDSANTATLTNVKLNATRTGGTSLLYKLWGTASQKVFGSGDSDNWILKPSTNYQLIITSTKPSNLGWLEASWYEEP